MSPKIWVQMTSLSNHWKAGLTANQAASNIASLDNSLSFPALICHVQFMLLKFGRKSGEDTTETRYIFTIQT